VDCFERPQTYSENGWLIESRCETRLDAPKADGWRNSRLVRPFSPHRRSGRPARPAGLARSFQL